MRRVDEARSVEEGVGDVVGGESELGEVGQEAQDVVEIAVGEAGEVVEDLEGVELAADVVEQGEDEGDGDVGTALDGQGGEGAGYACEIHDRVVPDAAGEVQALQGGRPGDVPEAAEADALEGGGGGRAAGEVEGFELCEPADGLEEVREGERFGDEGEVEEAEVPTFGQCGQRVDAGILSAPFFSSAPVSRARPLQLLTRTKLGEPQTPPSPPSPFPVVWPSSSCSRRAPAYSCPVS